MSKMWRSSHFFNIHPLHHAHDGSIEIIIAKRQIANRTVDGFMPKRDLDDFEFSSLFINSCSECFAQRVCGYVAKLPYFGK